MNPSDGDLGYIMAEYPGTQQNLPDGDPQPACIQHGLPYAMLADDGEWYCASVRGVYPLLGDLVTTAYKPEDFDFTATCTGNDPQRYCKSILCTSPPTFLLRISCYQQTWPINKYRVAIEILRWLSWVK